MVRDDGLGAADNRPDRRPEVEEILGIGNWGTNGMAVPVGRLTVDAVAAGIDRRCLGGGDRERISMDLRPTAAGWSRCSTSGRRRRHSRRSEIESADMNSSRPDGGTSPEPSRRGRRKDWRLVAHWLVVVAAVGYLAWVTPGLAADATRAISRLDHLAWGWVAVAVLCGVAALVLYGELHRQLLLVGGARVSVAAVQGINFVENAVSVTVPVVGGVGAVVFAIDQLRRRHVDAALASWSVLAAGVISTVTLLVLGAVGLGVTGRIPLVLGLAVAVLITLGCVGMWKVVSHPDVLRRVLHRLVGLGRWVPGLCGSCRFARAARAEEASRRLATRIVLLRPSAGRWAVLILLAALPWVLDFCCLAVSMVAVGTGVPWGALLVGFLLVQLSVALQIFPGGAGLAETSLLALLLAAGVEAGPAAASVLIYRSITWLGMALVGWALYALSIHTSPLHLHRHAPELAQV
jgi:putative heme transporter